MCNWFRAARTRRALRPRSRRSTTAGSAKYAFDIDWQLTGTPEVAPPLVVAHRVDRDGARTRLPGHRGAARRVSPVGDLTFDPNVRPALIEDADAARARIDRLLERADVVKASDEDLHWIDPTRTPEQIAPAWLALGPSIVVVTMGADGAFAMCAAGTVRVPASEWTWWTPWARATRS